LQIGQRREFVVISVSSFLVVGRLLRPCRSSAEPGMRSTRTST
jgi:hypothetical protein